MEEEKSDFNEQTSFFEQTVVTSEEQLKILPENILSLFDNYLKGNIQPTSKEEVSFLLQRWFEGSLTKQDVFTCECEYTACDIDAGFESYTGHKRSRFDSDV